MVTNNNNSKKPKCLQYRRMIEQFADDPSKRMSRSLTNHVDSCPECAKYLNQVANVHFLLEQLKWQSMPAGTLALCNTKAMKKLETRIRNSEKGQKLAQAMPDIPRWQKTTIRLSRGGIGIAAGLAILLLNYSTTKGLCLTQKQLEKLGQIHQEKHIGNWENLDENII